MGRGVNMKKLSRKQLVKGIGKLQDLIGRAKSAYQNDRDPYRSDHVVDPLEEAFDLCVVLRSTDDC